MSIDDGAPTQVIPQTTADGRWRWVRLGALLVILVLLAGGIASGVSAYTRYLAQLPARTLTVVISTRATFGRETSKSTSTLARESRNMLLSFSHRLCLS